jgi:hypothetical protein
MLSAAHATAAKRFGRLFSLNLHTVAALLASVQFSGMTRERILQRLIIAEALVQGVRIASIARRLGVSRSWASREANAPETRLMLAALLEKNARRMGQLLDYGWQHNASESASSARADSGSRTSHPAAP